MTTSTKIIKFILIAAVVLFALLLLMTAFYTSKQTLDDGSKLYHSDKYRVNPELRKMMYLCLPTYASMKMLEHKMDRWQGAPIIVNKDKGWAIFAYIMNVLFAIWWAFYNPEKEGTFKDILDKVLPILALLQIIGIFFILFSDLSIFVTKVVR